VAACFKQRTASGVLAFAPSELSIPRADAMVVIHFAVMQSAEQAFVQDAFDGEELTREAAFETDAGFDAALPDRTLDRSQVLKREGQGFSMIRCLPALRHG